MYDDYEEEFPQPSKEERAEHMRKLNICIKQNEDMIRDKQKVFDSLCPVIAGTWLN